MKKEHSNPVPPEIQAEIDDLAASQEPIRTDLIPEAMGDWSKAKRGLFYRPIKKQITLRLDADLIDWFKTHAKQGEGYQTSINRALREYVTQKNK
ncbi:BrnA antitoxin family protein [Crocosphaera sp. XPORK-15E]|uniref:BrnA antitoxin family protein n=1 Tax=Crocosphaera sp. XPORK-15E TaxID=3110247 RepID=UPI002B1EA7D4|nr:BrnA antitoxin family protein [Crocosphaera sp. XPORK-15E]MEA5532575.1 BrnA antitoxin family protein [Crocosphaera sp. XPORK-15E]